MSIFPRDKALIDAFFADISLKEKAYTLAAFVYVASRREGSHRILRGRLVLTEARTNVPSFHFQTENIRAGRITLAELGLDPKAFVTELLGGKINVPGGPLEFLVDSGGRYAATYVPVHPDGIQDQRRIGFLTIMAGEISLPKQPETDWEVKAAATPFNNVQEIISDLGLGGLGGVTAQVEIIALNVAAIDGQTSRLSGTAAAVNLLLAKNLDTEKAMLGYCVYVSGKAIARKSLIGSELAWNEEASIQRGSAIIEVPEGAVLNCIASYEGVAQSHFWLADPEKSQNSRRAFYERFDPKLEILMSTITVASQRGQDARQLESAVAWILWMLGFSAAQLTGSPRMRDAPDLLVATPAGHFAVVEVTTGLLKAENKLASLHSRAETVRANLAESKSGHIRVLPIIVTSRTRAEIAIDLETAERQGICVLTKEDIDQAITRTLIQPNADQLYEQAEQAVTASLERHNKEPALPLGNGSG